MNQSDLAVERQKLLQEEQANRYTLRGIWFTLLFMAVVWILTISNVFILEKDSTTVSIMAAAVFLLFPIAVSKHFSLREKWFKFAALSAYVVAIFVMASMLTYHMVLAYALPLYFAVQYRHKRILWITLVISVLCMGAATFVGFRHGVLDANMLLWTTHSLPYYLDESTNVLRNFEVVEHPYYGIFVFYILPRALLMTLSAFLLQSVTERNREASQQIAKLSAYHEMAERDSLTGLGNRMAFDRHMKRIQNNPNLEATLVFLDLNHLKYTNDTFGHNAGDELLMAAGGCIRTAFDGIGVCYRMGGDEFGVIIESPDRADADYLDRLNREVERFNSRKKENLLSIAGGASRLLPGERTAKQISDWKTEADKQMYANKMETKGVLTQNGAEEYGEIINDFVAMLEARDPYTAHHSQRVTELARAICGWLGLSDQTTQQILIAASIHDIGKVSIPDAVLFKKTSLTGEEWDVLKQHSMAGFKILSRSRSLFEAAMMILNHHERYDGTGYPNGTAGPEIPLGSRVIAIADSIDAMTWERTYRAALSLDACREEIRANLGKMYDPSIGEIVLEHWDCVAQIVDRQKMRRS